MTGAEFKDWQQRQESRGVKVSGTPNAVRRATGQPLIDVAAHAAVIASYSAPKVPKPSKYKNKKVVADGITFDSQGEYVRWSNLSTMATVGLITELERQVQYTLAPSCIIEGRKKPAMKFTLDFRYRNHSGELVIEDFKSPATVKETSFIMRRHLLKTVHGLDVNIHYK